MEGCDPGPPTLGPEEGDDDTERAIVLTLGLTGAAVQSIVAEAALRRLDVALVNVVAVANPGIPVGGSLGLTLAAELAWGARALRAADVLAWASDGFAWLDRRRPDQRRLIAMETRPLRPHRYCVRPYLMTPAGGRTGASVGLITDDAVAVAVRAAVDALREARGADPGIAFCARPFTAAGPATGAAAVAPGCTQFTIRDDSAPGSLALRRELEAHLPPDATTNGAILWWSADDGSEVLLAPVADWAVPAAVLEIRLALHSDYPECGVLITPNGILLAGVDHILAPGLLNTVLGGRACGGRAAFGKGQLHVPLRISRVGECLASGRRFALTCPAYALADTDTCVVLYAPDDAGEELLRAASARIGHPCSASRVEALQDDGAHYRAGWLVRVPASGRTATAEWATENFRLNLHRGEVQGVPAPLIRAIGSTRSRNPLAHEAAALAQTGWSGAGPNLSAIFLATKVAPPTGGGSSDPQATMDDYRRLRPDWWPESPGLPLGLAHTTTLPGVRLDLACWRPADTSPDFTFPDGPAAAAAILRKAFRSILSARPDQGRPDPSDEGPTTDLTLDKGDVLAFLVPGGTDVTIRTATHLASCFLTADTWVCIGMRPSHGPGTACVPAMQPQVVTSRSSVQTWAYRACWRAEPMACSVDRPLAAAARGCMPAPAGCGIPDTGTDGGGPRAMRPLGILDWLAAALDAGEGVRWDAAGLRDEDRLAHSILLTYTPRPSADAVGALAAWVRERVCALAGPDARPVTRWMWPWVLYTWALDYAGIGRLRAQDPVRQADLVRQMRLPSWVGEPAPICQWRVGKSGLAPDHYFTGMRGGPDRNARTLCDAGPPLSDAVLADLNGLVDLASGRQGGADDGDGARGGEPGGAAPAGGSSPRTR